jgi:hypothetical protein
LPRPMSPMPRESTPLWPFRPHQIESQNSHVIFVSPLTLWKDADADISHPERSQDRVCEVAIADQRARKTLRNPALAVLDPLIQLDAEP